MSDKRLAELQSLIQSDPSDQEVILEWLTRRAESEGDKVYLDFLEDRLRWNRSSEAIQDLAIKAVAKRLPGCFRFRETKVFRCQQSQRIAIFEPRGTEMQFCLLPGGTYTMGSDGGIDFAEPTHQVKVKPFLMARWPTRQCEWTKFSQIKYSWFGFRNDGGNPSSRQAPHCPVDNVSWKDCQAWLKNAVDELEGVGLRLPSEAEWEYACRAGTGSRFFWGETMDNRYCWNSNNCSFGTRGSSEHKHMTNDFGLTDMLGHVWEWCEDYWQDNYRDGPTTQEPRLTGAANHVLRGGSWADNSSLCESASRSNFKFIGRDGNKVGCRFAMDIPGQT